MFNAFRTDKNTLVVQEKITQSSTRPKSGPCMPITQLAQPNLRLVLAGASDVRAVTVFSSWGGNITTNYSDYSFEGGEQIALSASRRCHNVERALHGCQSWCTRPENRRSGIVPIVRVAITAKHTPLPDHRTHYVLPP